MRIISKIFCVAVSIAFLSCESFLDRKPLASPNTATFLVNEAEMEQALNALYRSLDWRTGATPYQQNFDLWTDIGVDRSPGIASGIFDSYNAQLQEVWSYAYKTIQKANTLLEGMEKGRENVSEKSFNRIQAEAITIRAFAYFYLTFLFGDVPLITKPLSPEEYLQESAVQADIVDFLLTDLETAHYWLDWASPDVGRITKGVCVGLKSRIAFYAERYTVAAEAARMIIESNIYGLNPRFERLFTRSGQMENNANEIMFYFLHPSDASLKTSVPLGQASRNLGGQSGKFPTQRLVDMFECIDGKRIDESSIYDFKNPSANRDKRLRWTVSMHGDTIPGVFNNGQPTQLCVFNIYDSNTAIFNASTGEWITSTNNDKSNPFGPVNSGVGYLWAKYTYNDEPLTNAKVGWIFMRYAEILLTYAESMVEIGDVDELAIESLNALRARGGLPLLDRTYDIGELKKIVRRERSVELALEGFRWFDIRRWKIAEYVMPGVVFGASKLYESPATTADFKVNSITDLNNIPDYTKSADDRLSRDLRSFETKHYLMPIPQREIDINPNLVQNEGW